MSAESPAERPFHVGLYLGVTPIRGGMFQYAQTFAESLATLPSDAFRVTVAYGDPRWADILGALPVGRLVLTELARGERIAVAAMVARIPGALCRKVGRMCNPLVREMLAVGCDAWIFPAQESLAYQFPGTAIATIHDLMHRYEPHFPEVRSLFRRGIRDHRFGSLARECSRVLVDSEVGRRHVVESYGADPARIFALPYIAPGHISSARERSDFDSTYRLPPRFLFYPAQFWRHKNHTRLLEALKLTVADCPDIQLVLSGGFRYEYQRVLAKVRQLDLADRVHFVGYVPDGDLRGFYVRARALVMATFFGPTNIPPLEAMAAGCPAVVSGIYAMPEQLGEAGLYFNPSSVEDIAGQIRRIWHDDVLAAQMVQKGRERTAAAGPAVFRRRLMDLLDGLRTGK
jgi:glycosyltransferase involved in cell wall biosynthesis